MEFLNQKTVFVIAPKGCYVYRIILKSETSKSQRIRICNFCDLRKVCDFKIILKIRLNL